MKAKSLLISKKTLLETRIQLLYQVCFETITRFVADGFQYINKRRPRIFLYTDSRGFNISKKSYSKNPFAFYPGYFIKKYQVDYFLCPETHTTLIDFLQAYYSSLQNYDYVIAHVGIVDFSPRHQAVAQQIYNLKKQGYDNIFGEEVMTQYLNTDLGVEYENQKTINMFSLEMARLSLLPILLKIPNLIWIGCNNFVKGWEGNYYRQRPLNISYVEDYSRLFCKLLPSAVDISDWDKASVMENTYDNIHLTQIGGKIVISRILNEMEEILTKKDKV